MTGSRWEGVTGPKVSEKASEKESERRWGYVNCKSMETTAIYIKLLIIITLF